VRTTLKAPRLPDPPKVLWARLAALIAVLALAAPHAVAQDAMTTDRWLMRPVLDGSPKQLPRFQPLARAPRQPVTLTPTGEVPKVGNPPGNGAGTTGFVSTNDPRQKTKAGRTARKPAAKKSKTAVQTEPPPPPEPISPALRARLRPQERPWQPAITTTTATVTNAALRRRPLPTDENPFDAVGVQIGAFVFKPSLELSTGWDTNPARTTNGKGSSVFIVTPELKANSVWQRHELTTLLRGSYTTYGTQHSLDRPNAEAKATARIDVTELTRVDLESRLLVATDNPGSPNLQAGLARFPINTTIGATAGITQRFNRLEVSLKTTADRTVYQPSKLTDGTTVSNDDRNYNLYAVLWRTAYELMPGMKPFVEVGLDTRVHDLELDASGVMRDSKGFTAKVGSTFEYSRLLTGETAIGYIVRDYKDPALQRLTGITYDSSLTWTVTALTTIKLTAGTKVDESTLVGVSGVFTREAAVQVDHAYRRWLIGTLKFSRALDDYRGSPRQDTRYTISAALTYMLSRTMHLKSEWRREWLTSSVAGNDYSADIFLLSLKFQR
jgi:hypothetical protein